MGIVPARGGALARPHRRRRVPPNTRRRGRPNTAMTIPGTPEQAARRVEAVSVEGRPADAKSGPGTLWIELGAAALVIIAGATAVGLWFGVLGGVAAFFLGLLALLANPEVAAAILRVRDRSAAVARAQDQSRDRR